MSGKDGNLVAREVRIAARPETVFQFFVEPEKLLRWKGVEAAIDPCPGGIHRVNINGRDVACGRYLEVVPNRRIVLTWGWEGSPIAPGSTTVEIDLVPDGDGTIVRLLHRDLPPGAMDEHDRGWRHYLARLAVVAAGGDPGPDQFMA